MKLKQLIMVAVLVVFSYGIAFSAANTVTSSTGTKAGTDPSFTVTYRPLSGEGAVLFLKYTKGSEANITITFDTINTALSVTDKYRYPTLSGTALSAYTVVITASGNYRIPLPLIPSEKRLIANIVFASAGTDGVVVANFTEP